MLVVELLDPAFDADTGTVTYGANVLTDYDGAGLASLAARQRDEALPATLSNVSLFIDDCPDIANCYTPDVGDGTTNVGPVPGGPIGACWTWRELGVCAVQWQFGRLLQRSLHHCVPRGLPQRVCRLDRLMHRARPWLAMAAGGPMAGPGATVAARLATPRAPAIGPLFAANHPSHPINPQGHRYAKIVVY